MSSRACRPRRRRPGTWHEHGPVLVGRPARRRRSRAGATRRPPARVVDARAPMGAGVPSPPATWMRAGLCIRTRLASTQHVHVQISDCSLFPRSPPFLRRRRRRSPSRRVSSWAESAQSVTKTIPKPVSSRAQSADAIIGTAGAPVASGVRKATDGLSGASRSRIRPPALRGARLSDDAVFAAAIASSNSTGRAARPSPETPKLSAERAARPRLTSRRLRVLGHARPLEAAPRRPPRAQRGALRLSVAPPRAMAWRQASYTASQSSASAANAASGAAGPALSHSSARFNKCASRGQSGGRSALLASLARSSGAASASSSCFASSCGAATTPAARLSSPPASQHQLAVALPLSGPRLRASEPQDDRRGLIAVQCCLTFALRNNAAQNTLCYRCLRYISKTYRCGAVK